jgi:hypothetical protein
LAAIGEQIEMEEPESMKALIFLHLHEHRLLPLPMDELNVYRKITLVVK